MKKVLLSTVALIAFAAPAAAADLAARPYVKAPPAPIAVVYDWSGFYIGANGGWGSSRKCWDFTTPAGTFVAAEGCHDATGGTAGGQIGYRWQTGTWVFGLEAQGNWADFQGSNVSLIDPTLRNQSRIDAFGLFTGQIGCAANNVLFYVKGGAAVTADRFRQFDVPTGVAGCQHRRRHPLGRRGRRRASNSASRRTGRSASNTTTCSCRTAPIPSSTPTGAFFGTDRIRQDVDLVTVRVNYRWGGPVIAKY